MSGTVIILTWILLVFSVCKFVSLLFNVKLTSIGRVVWGLISGCSASVILLFGGVSIDSFLVSLSLNLFKKKVHLI